MKDFKRHKKECAALAERGKEAKARLPDGSKPRKCLEARAYRKGQDGNFEGFTMSTRTFSAEKLRELCSISSKEALGIDEDAVGHRERGAGASSPAGPCAGFGCCEGKVGVEVELGSRVRAVDRVLTGDVLHDVMGIAESWHEDVQEWLVRLDGTKVGIFMRPSSLVVVSSKEDMNEGERVNCSCGQKFKIVSSDFDSHGVRDNLIHWPYGEKKEAKCPCRGVIRWPDAVMFMHCTAC